MSATVGSAESDHGSLLHVRVERGDFTLDVEFEWRERVAVLFGPSGSGKTTLLEAALGLSARAWARVRLGGEWLEDADRGFRLPVERRRLGWVPQDPTLFPHLTVDGNLRFGISRAGSEGPRALSRAIEVLEIGGLLGRRTDGLSGGERQRIALARALASRPRALLLDEPLAALDLPLRARVLPYLLRIRDELDLPILYITHDPDEAMLLGETVAVLDSGRLVAVGPAREVLWSRAVRPLSEALGLENVFDGRALESETGGEGSQIETRGGLRLFVPWKVAPGTPVSVGIRAEDLLLSTEEPGPISARNVVPCRVVGCEAREGDVLVELDAGERVTAKLTPNAVRELGLEVGTPAHLIAKAQAIRRLS